METVFCEEYCFPECSWPCIAHHFITQICMFYISRSIFIFIPRSKFWRSRLANGFVIHGFGGLGVIFLVLIGTYLSKRDLRTVWYGWESSQKVNFGWLIKAESLMSEIKFVIGMPLTRLYEKDFLIGCDTGLTPTSPITVIWSDRPSDLYQVTCCSSDK